MIRTHQNAGVSLIEMLIGIVISAIIIGAMYTTYSVINQTYSRVSDVSGISKSGRDIVSMIMRDVRMAGLNITMVTMLRMKQDLKSENSKN